MSCTWGVTRLLPYYQVDLQYKHTVVVVHKWEYAKYNSHLIWHTLVFQQHDTQPCGFHLIVTVCVCTRGFVYHHEVGIHIIQFDLPYALNKMHTLKKMGTHGSH